MRFDYPYLKDRKFLKQVDLMNIRVQTIKITVLNWEEEPVQSIEGTVTSGSINIDGKSSVRRTANLSLIADNVINNLENVDNLISLNKKIFIALIFERCALLFYVQRFLLYIFFNFFSYCF